MDKKELINELKFIRDSYSNENRFRGGVRTGLGIALGVIDKLDEPEKVEPLVVPKELGEWLAEQNLGNEGGLFSIIGRLEDMWPNSHFEDFITDNKKQLIEVIIGIRPYEVEKEKLYYVKLPNTNSISEYLYLAQGSVSGDYWFNSRPERLDYEGNACKHKFTEKQIKDYDERYIPFMVPVDEVNND